MQNYDYLPTKSNISVDNFANRGANATFCRIEHIIQIATMQKNDAVVIIPTYNEKENIEAILRAVTGLEEHGFDVLVIDDGSPDGTAAIVKQLMAGDLKDRVHLVERQGKLGLGTAYIAGVMALEQTTNTL